MTAVPSGWTVEQARKRLDAARRERFRHNANFYGPMKDATCGCPTCEDKADYLLDVPALLALLADAREALGRTADRTDEDGLPCWCLTPPRSDEHQPYCLHARAFLARFAADEDTTP